MCLGWGPVSWPSGGRHTHPGLLALVACLRPGADFKQGLWCIQPPCAHANACEPHPGSQYPCVLLEGTRSADPGTQSRGDARRAASAASSPVHRALTPFLRLL